jgi:aspartyl-tRNA(Asn)/glutamyl-tRNA(Gln) amidotransferase subunit A
MGDPCFLTITRAAAARAAKELTALELTERYLARIAQLDRTINAFLRVLPQEARRSAAASDVRASRGALLGPLDGAQLALKDLVDIEGVPTTAGLGAKDPPPAAANAEVVRRLREAGAVVLGKLNLHEAALGGTNDNPFWGRTGNPHNLECTPGGSSGGSGAAVAASLVAAAIGTDTMGSVRIPAAYCGIVGLKPTWGLVSPRGVHPLSRRLDHVGVLARDVTDAALVLQALAGFDPESPDSRKPPRRTNLVAGLGDGVAGMTIGVASEFASVAVEPAVARAFGAALDSLRGLGCLLREIDLARYDPTRARRAGLLVIEAEAAAIYATQFDAAPDAFSPALRGMLDYGRNTAVPRLVEALYCVEEAGETLRRRCAAVDALVTPTVPQAAFPFGTAAPVNQADFCAVANFAGCPAISVPMGCDERGLPLGLQIIAAPFAERRLIALARAFEQAAGGAVLPPPPYGPG